MATKVAELAIALFRARNGQVQIFYRYPECFKHPVKVSDRLQIFEEIDGSSCAAYCHRRLAPARAL